MELRNTPKGHVNASWPSLGFASNFLSNDNSSGSDAQSFSSCERRLCQAATENATLGNFPPKNQCWHGRKASPFPLTLPFLPTAIRCSWTSAFIRAVAERYI